MQVCTELTPKSHYCTVVPLFTCKCHTRVHVAIAILCYVPLLALAPLVLLPLALYSPLVALAPLAASCAYCPLKCLEPSCHSSGSCSSCASCAIASCGSCASYRLRLHVLNVLRI